MRERFSGSEPTEPLQQGLAAMRRMSPRALAHRVGDPDAVDAAELDREINYRQPYRDTRFFKLNPPGHNVMVGMGAACALAGFAFGGGVAMAVFGTSGLGPPLGFITGSILALVLGLWLPETIWLGIGPGVRAVIRPIGYLGAWPFIVGPLLALGFLTGTVKVIIHGPPPARGHSAVSYQGDRWRIITDVYRGREKPVTMTIREARVACAAIGGGWRLPTAADASRVNARLTGRTLDHCRFHLDREATPGLRYLGYARGIGWRVESSAVATPRQVLCIRD